MLINLVLPTIEIQKLQRLLKQIQNHRRKSIRKKSISKKWKLKKKKKIFKIEKKIHFLWEIRCWWLITSIPCYHGTIVSSIWMILTLHPISFDIFFFDSEKFVVNLSIINQSWLHLIKNIVSDTSSILPHLNLVYKKNGVGRSAYEQTKK